MASRSKLWIPFDTGSTSISSADVQVDIDGRYLIEVGAEFKGTILAVKGWYSVRQDTPSNALEAFACGIGVFDKGASVSAGTPILSQDVSSKWLWYNFVPVGGPGGDSTALVNVMAPYTFPLESRSKRTVGFQDRIRFVGSSVDNTTMKFRACGRILLLEA